MKLNFRRGGAFASKKAREYLKDKKPEDIKNITIIRHAAIGDFMNIRPFLIELREFFPKAKITLSVIRHYMYGIPEDLIDDIHILTRYKVNGSKTGIFTRINEIKKLPPQDIIFDLTDSTFTVMLVFLVKAKLKIGYPYRSLRRIFFDIATLRSEFVAETQSILHMLNILGAKTKNPFKYGLKSKYYLKMENRIVYFAGASNLGKCWEAEKFTKLIDKMSKKYPLYKHVILQGIKDNEKFYDIYEPLKEKENVILQKTMSIEDVLSFLANSNCLISNDTGIRNIGIALEIPTIGIFFATPVFRYWPREEKHDCVFNIEYTSPNVDDMYKSTTSMIDRLYKK